MKYGLLTYAENKKTFNIGDYIQSLAAKQFLPNVDVFLNRERLADYKGDLTKLIMNGWFTHNIHNWIPAIDVNPLFVSFHLNNTAAPYMLNNQGIAYLKQHSPIGCRDQFTAETLRNKGIDAYFTGCLTLTLDSYKVDDNERNGNIYIVDPLYSYIDSTKLFYDFKSLLRNIKNGEILNIGKKKKHIQQFIDPNLLKNAIYINQELPSNTYSEEQKFNIAEDLIYKYARARLVITSRIHCALPCLALGTPVIFINGFSSFVDSCRFDGILDLFNRLDINSETGEFKANFPLIGQINAETIVQNSNKHIDLANSLRKICKSFIDTSPRC